MQATPPSTRKSNTPTSAFAQPPFSKDVGQVPYPRLQCEETLPHLSVKRLNSISSHLWLAGRPQADHLRKSTLHHLNATGFQLVILEDADLHLLWKNDMIYIKPLPSCLLNFDFWQENLCSSVEDCDPDQADIISGALGLLLSYTWLIRWESDLNLAHEHHLINESIDYDTWMAFRHSFLTTFKRSNLPRPWLSWRYDFAELRLKRINWIWALRPRTPFDMSSLVRGYQSPYRLYTSFFEQNFSIVIVAFVYVTVVLTAMQLGLATDQLTTNHKFQRACVGFAVFCILLPVVVLGFVLMLVVFLFFWNWWVTVRHFKSVHVQHPVAPGIESRN